VRQGVGTTLPSPPHFVQVVCAHRAGTIAAIAALYECAGLRTRTVTRFALREMIEGQFTFRAAIRVFERDPQIVAQIGASCRTVLALRLAAAASEEHVEDVAEALAAAETEAAHAARRTIGHRPEAIVLLPLGGIGQYLVGFIDLFEVRLRGRLVIGDVGMITAGQSAIGALDVVLGSVATDAEYRVEIGRHESLNVDPYRRGGG